MFKILSRLLMTVGVVVVSSLLSSSVFAMTGIDTKLGGDYVKKGSQYYEQGLIGAKKYMNLQRNDEFWVGKSPKIENYGVLSYTDNESVPAYIEYKIVCGKDDCGSVTVNLDGNDVLVPEGAVFGKTNYENLLSLSKGKSTKLYRFGLLEQYGAGANNEGVASIDTTKPDIGYPDIESFKQRTKTFKQSSEFKNLKQGMNFSTQASSSTFTTLADTPTNTYVPGTSTVNCPSRTPCYAQFQDTYYGSTCYLGCSPNALAILYGYYDKQGTYPNLINGIATDISNTWNISGTWFPLDIYVGSVSNTIRSYMSTMCSNGYGGTVPSNIQYGKQYAKDRGYTNTSATYGTLANAGQTRTVVKNQVDMGRPLILSSTNGNSGHSFVAYGYSSDTSSYMIRVNYGLTVNQDTSYFGRDVNAASLSLPTVGGAFSAYTTFTIQ